MAEEAVGFLLTTLKQMPRKLQEVQQEVQELQQQLQWIQEQPHSQLPQLFPLLQQRLLEEQVLAHVWQQGLHQRRQWAQHQRQVQEVRRQQWLHQMQQEEQEERREQLRQQWLHQLQQEKQEAKHQLQQQKVRLQQEEQEVQHQLQQQEGRQQWLHQLQQEEQEVKQEQVQDKLQHVQGQLQLQELWRQLLHLEVQKVQQLQQEVQEVRWLLLLQEVQKVVQQLQLLQEVQQRQLQQRWQVLQLAQGQLQEQELQEVLLPLEELLLQEELQQLQQQQLQLQLLQLPRHLQLIEELENNLHLFKAFLRDSTKKRFNHYDVPAVVSQIHDVVDVVQRVISDILMDQTLTVSLLSMLNNLYGNIIQVESIGETVRAIYADQNVLDMANLNINGDGAPHESVPKFQLIRQDNLVGLEDEAETIIGYLTEEWEKLDVISIIGMAGLGKTTLAWKIFQSTQIQNHFANRFWIHSSHKFSLRDVLLQILSRITNQDVSDNTNEDLAQAIHAYLEGRHFLLVMDDVWTVKDWNYIQKFLPKGNSRGKVLITSRDKNVGIHANPTRNPLKLRFLTSDESWQLLQYEVFGKHNYFPTELEEIGRMIARKCDGVPRSVVTIGRDLVKSFSMTEDMSAMKLILEKMSRELGAILNMSEIGSDGIALSYDKLTKELRHCFLYLGVFPQNWEISAWTLIRLWIAEGFIQQKKGQSLEETAEDNLNDLINMNLIFASRTNMSGKVKTCHIHNMIHEFCKSKVGKNPQNMFQEIKMSEEGVFDPPISEIKKYQRLCIHSHLSTFLSQKNLEGPRVQSLLLFSKEPNVLKQSHIEGIPASFNLLKVLESNSVTFLDFPYDIYKCKHLRYITLSIDGLCALPYNISMLWNLQTLLVSTTSHSLIMDMIIWSKTQLRHLKTNVAIILSKTSNSACRNLQTLTNLSPKCCTKEVLNNTYNIKKLGIRGSLDILLRSDYSLAALDCLENLKMMMTGEYAESASENPLPNLPPPSQFPPNLKSLTLSHTFLEWSHMSILGLLENLEVLKLKDNAFWGHSWEVKDRGFPRLEALHIGRTNLTFWMASHHHYPRLKCLELHNCEELKEVPIGLADILSFQRLDLYYSNGAVNSASKIHEAKQQKWGEQNFTNGEFKLSIFPRPG